MLEPWAESVSELSSYGMVLVCACIESIRIEHLRLLNQNCRTHWQLYCSVPAAEPEPSVELEMPSVFVFVEKCICDWEDIEEVKRGENGSAKRSGMRADLIEVWVVRG